MLQDLLRSSRRDLAFVSTEKGIFTETGTWFTATEDDISEYAGAVLKVRPLPRLLAEADLWLRSPQILAVWSALPLLHVLPPVAGVLATATCYLGWAVVGPSFVNLASVPVLRVADHVLLQGAAYVVVLSIWASAGAFGAVWGGVLVFVLLRWGIMERLTRLLEKPMQRSLYHLPVSDQVLRAIIVRSGMKHGVKLPQIEEMEQKIRQKWK